MKAGEVAFTSSAPHGPHTPLSTRQLLPVNMFTDTLPAAALAVTRSNSDLDTTARGLDEEAALWRTVAVRGAPPPLPRPSPANVRNHLGQLGWRLADHQ